MEGQEFKAPPQGRAAPASADTSTAAVAKRPPTRPHAARTAPRPPVPADVAAAVIGRAAELEQRRGTSHSAGFDEATLVEIGEDVGLSPDSVREALDQYHAGLLPTDDDRRETVVGPRTVIVERTVPGPIGRVDAMVSGLLSRKVFDCCRRSGYTTMWRPSEGLVASIQRTGKRLSRDRTLDDVTEINVSLIELPAAAGQVPQVRVTMEAECRSLRVGLGVTAVGGVAVGGAGALATAGAAVVGGEPLVLLGAPPLAALAAGSYFGARYTYRRKLADAELILQGGLDDLFEQPR